MHGRKNDAVSEIVGIILIVIIASSAISIILVAYQDIIGEEKISARVDSALNQFFTTDDVLSSMINQGSNCSRSVNFVIDTGYVSVDPKGTRVILYYSLRDDFTFDVSGFNDDEDKMFNFILRYPEYIQPGAGVAFYIDHLNGSTDSGSTSAIDNTTAQVPNVGLFQYPLTDSVKIDIKKSGIDEVIGRIWLFDVGAITYEMPSSSGTRTVVVENGGVISASQKAIDYVANGPIMYDISNLEGDTELVINLMQLDSEFEKTIGGTGGGSYKFSLRLNNTQIRENRIVIPESFKMQIYGDRASAWNNYFRISATPRFTSSYDAGLDLTTLNLIGSRIFTLTHSLFDVDLEAIE